MRYAYFALVLVLGGPAAALLADPDIGFPTPAAPGPGEMTPLPMQGPVAAAAAPANDQPLPLSVEALLGLPVALRLQAAVAVGDRVSLAVEGIGGLYVIVPFAGTGGRVLWTVAHGPGDTFQINPGIEIDFTSGSSGFIEYPQTFVTPTAQFLWLHNIGRSAQGEVGLEIGGGVPLDGHSGPGFVPRFSLCLGVRF